MVLVLNTFCYTYLLLIKVAFVCKYFYLKKRIMHGDSIFRYYLIISLKFEQCSNVYDNQILHEKLFEDCTIYK